MITDFLQIVQFVNWLSQSALNCSKQYRPKSDCEINGFLRQNNPSHQ